MINTLLAQSITEYIQESPLAKERGVHSQWCTNEKTAMEAASAIMELIVTKLFEQL